MYDLKLYIVSPTITGLVLQVLEVLEVRAPPLPPPPLWELTSTPKHLPNPYLFSCWFILHHAVHLNPLFRPL